MWSLNGVGRGRVFLYISVFYSEVPGIYVYSLHGILSASFCISVHFVMRECISLISVFSRHFCIFFETSRYRAKILVFFGKFLKSHRKSLMRKMHTRITKCTQMTEVYLLLNGVYYSEST